MDTVAVKKYKNTGSLKEAIELCNGFAGLKPGMKVLLKPNLVHISQDYFIPPYGVVTTTRIIEELIILLKEYGITDITIGEGSVIFDNIGTDHVFETLGYYDLKHTYNIKLIDFNASDYKEFYIHDDLQLQIANDVFNCDYFINVPVLKTHSVTKISLGLKNLKGCLSQESRKQCHHKKYDIEYCIACIGTLLKPHLTIIDGTYALELGPNYLGKAQRTDMIIASKNLLAADCIAASLLGLQPHEITQLSSLAEYENTSANVDTILVKGDSGEDDNMHFEYDFKWKEEGGGLKIFEQFNFAYNPDIHISKYDQTLCTGCCGLFDALQLLLLFSSQELSVTTEVLSGKICQASPGFDNTILLGNCIIKANAHNAYINNAIKIPGCPPTYLALKNSLKKSGYQINLSIFEKVRTFYWTQYSNSPDFDIAHFTARNILLL